MDGFPVICHERCCSKGGTYGTFSFWSRPRGLVGLDLPAHLADFSGVVKARWHGDWSGGSDFGVTSGPFSRQGHAKKCENIGSAGVVQWQNGSFPSCIRGFDSLRPLQYLTGLAAVFFTRFYSFCSLLLRIDSGGPNENLPVLTRKDVGGATRTAHVRLARFSCAVAAFVRRSASFVTATAESWIGLLEYSDG